MAHPKCETAQLTGVVVRKDGWPTARTLNNSNGLNLPYEQRELDLRSTRIDWVASERGNIRHHWLRCDAAVASTPRESIGVLVIWA
mmetsp:Transcript_33829/g.84303  ORF Transcript_33829/g.84303 Transcript_33829/m.84303 type:complete len:86 (+) Transcript_33829:206-463(+)